MRYIDLTLLDPTKDPLKEWINKANIKLEAAKKEKDSSKRKELINKYPLWTEIKDHLFETYGRKCWYSECDLVGDDGNVDHFRPKGRSKNEDGNIILEDGYWWLAYEYTNYRISCTYCNQSRKCKKTGNTQGKSDFFPLVDKSPTLKIGDDVSTEKYMLLDPTNKEDVNLLSFDVNGDVFSVTSDKIKKKRVKTSIKIYHLDDPGFVRNRKKVWVECLSFLYIFEIGFDLVDEKHMGMGIAGLKRYIGVMTTYSATAIECIKLQSVGKKWRDKLLQGLDIAP